MLRSAATAAVEPLANDLAASLQRQRDAELVRDGAPSLILLMDGLAESSGRPAAALAAARARVAYATAFLGREDRERARLMYARARDQALGVLSASGALRDPVASPIPQFEAQVARLGRRHVPALYTAAIAWLGWILNSDGAPEALAQLARPVAMMRRVAELDPDHDRGGVHLFFGIYCAVQPAGAGRDLAASRRHFERAQTVAGDGALMPRVAMAEYYARYAMDRELFDRLLAEVEAHADDPPGLELPNALARRRARELRALADEWF
ncbi:MAG: TRAP transporter TatT component family protein [Kiritimatiellae bacterium]|nr:TRAP transporter TatT component family protein [Kiritimatiellia bacterium]